MTDKQISEILEEEGYSFTDNLEESVFILKNGNLVDGGFSRLYCKRILQK